MPRTRFATWRMDARATCLSVFGRKYSSALMLFCCVRTARAYEKERSRQARSANMDLWAVTEAVEELQQARMRVFRRLRAYALQEGENESTSTTWTAAAMLWINHAHFAHPEALQEQLQLPAHLRIALWRLVSTLSEPQRERCFRAFCRTGFCCPESWWRSPPPGTNAVSISAP